MLLEDCGNTVISMNLLISFSVKTLKVAGFHKIAKICPQTPEHPSDLKQFAFHLAL